MTKASKRILSLYMLFTACFMAILLRIVYINISSYANAAQKQSTRTIVIGTTRGKIYDRRGQLLVDERSKLIAAVTPVIASEKYLSDYFTDGALKRKIEQGYPFVAPVKKRIDNELIRSFDVPLRYDDESLASHLVGYVDSSGRGITGIEKAFEAFLSEHGGKLSVSFEVDALGRILAGMDKTIRNENYNSPAGVALTLDKNIQLITERALKESDIESGCAIVLEAYSGDILALSSVPDFDRNNVEASFNEENSPLLNKALCSYSAGSVFKSVIAAFALESGISEDFSYKCGGSVKIGDKSFSCYGGNAHGQVDMSLALQKSCNTYFISLMEELDREKLSDFCRDLGFGKGINLCAGMSSEEGILPDIVSLGIPAGRANFSFGQGDLLVTPLQIAKAYNTLATGEVAEPRLIYGYCNKKGALTEESTTISARKILSDSTVEKIRRMLFLVTEKGIASNAKSELLSLAGKTGTAESGSFDKDGNELLRTWFAGFFPAEAPRYIVVVMDEKGVGGNVDCAPVFREICEKIALSESE